MLPSPWLHTIRSAWVGMSSRWTPRNSRRRPTRREWSCRASRGRSADRARSSPWPRRRPRGHSRPHRERQSRGWALRRHSRSAGRRPASGGVVPARGAEDPGGVPGIHVSGIAHEPGRRFAPPPRSSQPPSRSTPRGREERRRLDGGYTGRLIRHQALQCAQRAPKDYPGSISELDRSPRLLPAGHIEAEGVGVRAERLREARARSAGRRR